MSEPECNCEIGGHDWDCEYLNWEKRREWKVDELLSIVRELALNCRCPYPDTRCYYCGNQPGQDHKPDCLWLRAQKFREDK